MFLAIALVTSVGLICLLWLLWLGVNEPAVATAPHRHRAPERMRTVTTDAGATPIPEPVPPVLTLDRYRGELLESVERIEKLEDEVARQRIAILRLAHEVRLRPRPDQIVLVLDSRHNTQATVTEIAARLDVDPAEAERRLRALSERTGQVIDIGRNRWQLASAS